MQLVQLGPTTSVPRHPGLVKVVSLSRIVHRNAEVAAAPHGVDSEGKESGKESRAGQHRHLELVVADYVIDAETKKLRKQKNAGTQVCENVSRRNGLIFRREGVGRELEK